MEPTSENTKNVQLALPTEMDYRALYERRFRPEIVEWADHVARRPSLTEYLDVGCARQTDPEIIERLIRVEGEAVGTVTAFAVNRLTGECELSIAIVDPGRWGRGIGGKAIALFLDLLRATGVRDVYLETFADNTRARRAFAKAGFEERRRYWDSKASREIVAMCCTIARRPSAWMVDRAMQEHIVPTAHPI